MHTLALYLDTVRETTTAEAFNPASPFLGAFQENVQTAEQQDRYGESVEPCNGHRSTMVRDAQRLSVIYHDRRRKLLDVQ